MRYLELDKKTIENLFDGKHGTQGEILIKIYKMVFPQWDDIKFIDGWPTISENTNKQIFRLFIDFDAKHHPGALPGGLWMNNGFSSLKSSDLIDWTVDLSTCKVQLKE